MTEFLEIAKTFGPFAAIAIFLIYQQRKDYQGVCKRLNEVEDYCKNTLADLVKQTIQVIERNNDIAAKCHNRTEEK